MRWRRPCIRRLTLCAKAFKEQIKVLEKARGRRELTMEEEKLILQLKKDLDNAERTVMREVRDIEKEVG